MKFVHLLPNSLLWRLLLLIFLLITISQILSYLLFNRLQSNTWAENKASQIITVINVTREALLSAQEDKVFPLLLSLSEKQGVRIYAADPFEEIAPLPSNRFYQSLASKIRSAIGKDTLIAVNHLNVKGLWVGFEVNEENYWMVFPPVDTNYTLSTYWLIGVLVILLFSFSGAYIIATIVNRPLKLLISTANKISQGKSPPPLPEEGVSELATVNRTFNEMMNSIKHLDEDRVLFLAGVSHDLRTPLARLRLAIELLSDENDDTLQKDSMIGDVDDMDSIINQFLDFSRGVEGDPVEMVPIKPFLMSVVEQYARVGKFIEVGYIPEKVLLIHPLSLRRLFDNLINNAFSYGEPPVTLSAKIESPYLIVQIVDHGTGIPESHQKRLLRPFERLDKSRSNLKGSGLGLSICDRIAKIHQGQIKFKNLPKNGGLEVSVYLFMDSIEGVEQGNFIL